MITKYFANININSNVIKNFPIRHISTLFTAAQAKRG